MNNNLIYILIINILRGVAVFLFVFYTAISISNYGNLKVSIFFDIIILLVLYLIVREYLLSLIEVCLLSLIDVGISLGILCLYIFYGIVDKSSKDLSLNYKRYN